ncbi:Myb transcription factor, partial [Thalictrum thalictroides]
WYTYLNSDFKKGGWSQEEDLILCEAQKIYGNRTDNAVKNRFSTLCKKRAKHEALLKENHSLSCVKQNNKRALFKNEFITNDTSESAPPLKKMRTHILDITENCKLNESRLHIKSGTTENHLLRPPFAVLVQNSHDVNDLPAQQTFNNTSTASDDGNSKVQRTFLRRDDPRITALMQQAELLSSLAVKVNTENDNQSLENAWKELQDFLKNNNENDLLGCQIAESDFPFEDLMHLLEESSNMGSLPCWRQPNLYESPGSSGYSTGSTLQAQTANQKTEHPEVEKCSLQQNTIVGQESIIFEENDGCGCEDGFIGSSVTSVCDQSRHTEIKVHACDWIDNFHISESVAQVTNSLSSDEKENEVRSADLPKTEFTSPVRVTPLFKTFAAAIPTPKFSESEKHFLMKTLGVTSPSPNPIHNTSQPPPCRRALLHSL